MRHSAPLACLLLSLSLSPALLAQANSVAGVATPVVLEDARLHLNGAGVRRLLGFKVYVAALYLPSPEQDAAQVLARDIPRRLVVTLLRDTTTDQNIDALRDGLTDNNSPAELEALQGEIARFMALIRQVHEVPEGTVIQVDYQPGRGTRLSIGGRDLGVIPGARFNRALLRIWLGDKPIQASLKNALLGREAS
jgi:hypothetical protein